MRFIEKQRGWHKVASRLLIIFAIIPTIYVFGVLVGNYLPRLGLPPCESQTNLTLAMHGLEAVLLGASIWLQFRAFRHPTYFALLAALLTLATAYLVQDAADDRDALRQQKCALRSLEEAMKACAANVAVIRRGKDLYGYDTLTLIAPGTTDHTWDCLWNWANHNGTASLKIDESVYRMVREAQEKAP